MSGEDRRQEIAFLQQKVSLRTPEQLWGRGTGVEEPPPQLLNLSCTRDEAAGISFLLTVG